MNTRTGGGRRGGRAPAVVMSVCFLLLAALNLLRGEWLGALFFAGGGLITLERRRVDRWPRAARYAVVLALAAAGVAMLVRIVLRLRAGV